MTDLSTWRLAQYFTVNDVAFLIAGLSPDGDAKDNAFARPVRQRILIANNQARKKVAERLKETAKSKMKQCDFSDLLLTFEQNAILKIQIKEYTSRVSLNRKLDLYSLGETLKLSDSESFARSTIVSWLTTEKIVSKFDFSIT